MKSCLRPCLSIAGLVALSLFTACGIGTYPGQPGVVTNGYSKIDLEDLGMDGLWVYEVSYDNRVGGKGVGAIVTKLYPNARTYTSNSRTNSHGTYYRAKAAYDGAAVQMIALPQQNQIMVPPDSKVMFLLGYVNSLDEVDDRNIAEQKLFTKSTLLSQAGMAVRKFRWDLVKAGRLLPTGNLAYEVTSIALGDKTFTPTEVVHFETNFFQNGVRSRVSAAVKKQAIDFLEANYPRGFDGVAKLYVKGATEAVAVKMSLHTMRTAEAAGVSIIKNASEELIQRTLAQFRN